jgi:hypothetical protein
VRSPQAPADARSTGAVRSGCVQQRTACSCGKSTRVSYILYPIITKHHYIWCDRRVRGPGPESLDGSGPPGLGGKPAATVSLYHLVEVKPDCRLPVFRLGNA